MIEFIICESGEYIYRIILFLIVFFSFYFIFISVYLSLKNYNSWFESINIIRSFCAPPVYGNFSYYKNMKYYSINNIIYKSYAVVNISALFVLLYLKNGTNICG